MGSFVYFILDTHGCIKIGTTRDPLKRLRQLRVAHSQHPYLVATMNGGVPDERALHRRFRRDRLAGEWFAPCRELCDLIDQLREAHGKARLWDGIPNPCAIGVTDSNRGRQLEILDSDEWQFVGGIH